MGKTAEIVVKNTVITHVHTMVYSENSPEIPTFWNHIVIAENFVS